MTKVFINKDAQFIHDFALVLREMATTQDVVRFETLAHDIDEAHASRLLTIANNIEGLDQKTLSSYSKGFTDGRNSVYARSNVAKVEPTDFTSLEEAIANFKGEVKKINPVVKKSMQETLTVDDLDLDL